MGRKIHERPERAEPSGDPKVDPALVRGCEVGGEGGVGKKLTKEGIENRIATKTGGGTGATKSWVGGCREKEKELQGLFSGITVFVNGVSVGGGWVGCVLCS